MAEDKVCYKLFSFTDSAVVDAQKRRNKLPIEVGFSFGTPTSLRVCELGEVGEVGEVGEEERIKKKEFSFTYCAATAFPIPFPVSPNALFAPPLTIRVKGCCPTICFINGLDKN